MFKSIACYVGVLSLFTATIASAETVTVRSGNGNGNTDSFVSFLIGSLGFDFSLPLPASAFSSAQTGPAAFIVSPNALWIAGLAADPAAHWIGTNVIAGTAQGNTGLYAQSFQINSTFTSATLTLNYAVDDHMGGVYLKGNAICANIIVNDLTNSTAQHTFTCTDAGPALHNGTNWLYIDAGNGGGAAGLLYSATITTTEGAILPHIAAGDVWTTDFFVINTGSQAAQFTLQFFDDFGNSLALPLPGGPTSTLAASVPPQGMNYYEASAPSSPLLLGWGLFTADSSVAVHAAFRTVTADGQLDEAAILSSPGTLEFIVPFDDSTIAGENVPLYTAIAIANTDPNNSANVVCVARDQSGVTIPNAVSVPPLNPLGHWSGYLFPVLNGVRGTIDCSASTSVSAVAFRFFGATFSSLPVLNINSTTAPPSP